MKTAFPATPNHGAPVTAEGRHLCERSLHWDGSAPFCGELAIVKTQAMCVHEHYGEGYVCAGCLSDMRKFCDDADWQCQACDFGPEAHGCPMPMTVTVLEMDGAR